MKKHVFLSSFLLFGLTMCSPTPASPSVPDTITEDTDHDEEGLWDASQNALRTGTKTISFYNLNDTHGAVSESGSGNSYEPGISKLATYLKKEKAKDPENFVLTSSGDMWQGSADSNITRGKLMNSWMNMMDFSAMTLGNHEFYWTIDTLKENQKEAEFPYLACNIVDTSTGETVDWAKPYTTITRNGVHIGIIGAIGEGITSSIIATNVRGLDFADPAAYVTEWSDYLRNNGADIILFIYHYSLSDIPSEIVNHVDAMFGGHNHCRENYTSQYGIPAIEAYKNGSSVGIETISGSFQNGNFVISDSTGVCYNTDETVFRAYPDDEETLAVESQYEDEIDTIKNEVVAYSSKDISKNELGELVTKYMYQYYEDTLSDIASFPIYCATHNSARSAISKGYITYGDIYKAFPFDNALTVIELSGKKAQSSYAAGAAYYHYYPGGEASYEEMENYDILTIDYMALNYCEENIIYTYASIYVRDVMKEYLPTDFPLN